MTSPTTVGRPDPRLTESWCGEGVAHDHQACGTLWNSADPRDVPAAARYADDLRGRESDSIPTIHEILELVRLYAVARLMLNASTPTRRTTGDPYYEKKHAEDGAECERLYSAIAVALARAGVPARRPE